jgi:hypothetical protein
MPPSPARASTTHPLNGRQLCRLVSEETLDRLERAVDTGEELFALSAHHVRGPQDAQGVTRRDRLKQRAFVACRVTPAGVAFDLLQIAQCRLAVLSSFAFNRGRN